jgi:23S rRNA (cytidine1920-2'-O)/16S rRNA (cytidine1409-2'-O)-methyltransferase
MKKERADKILVERGLAETRQKAQALIMAGLVSSEGRRIEKAGQPLDPEVALSVEKPLPYVGRGGFKLEQALDEFRVDPAGLICADIGSSTGGFTDCLLQRGAARVFCVDVDIRQLDDRIRRHPLVVTIEKNARAIVPADFPEMPALVVMDVSFISATLVLPAVIASAFPSDLPERRGRQLIVLVKPQFEAGREHVGKGGIVHDESAQLASVEKVKAAVLALGAARTDFIDSPILGAEGNREFLLYAEF